MKSYDQVKKMGERRQGRFALAEHLERQPERTLTTVIIDIRIIRVMSDSSLEVPESPR